HPDRPSRRSTALLAATPTATAAVEALGRNGARRTGTTPELMPESSCRAGEGASLERLATSGPSRVGRRPRKNVNSGRTCQGRRRLGRPRLRELTGEVRDMQKLYEQLALGLTRAMAVSLEDLKREEGQGAVEYALVVLGIAAVISLAVAGFATQITAFMTQAGAALLDFI